MSRDLNHCTFIGRLGNDPETLTMPNGTAVCNLSLAVGDDYKDKNGQKVEQTEWVRVSAFGKLAEIMAQYLKKGSKVYIAGKMKTRSYDKDGQKHYATGISASEMFMLDGKDSGQGSQQQANSGQSSHRPAQQQAPAADDFNDDIPF
jgi:single-strand DNA-binding protein